MKEANNLKTTLLHRAEEHLPPRSFSDCNEKFWGWLAALSPLAAIALAFLIQPGISYMRWDNYESYTPLISFAHETILSGNFPHWNPYQFMGEPLHAQTQTGDFYFPYTIAYLLVRLLGIGNERLTLMIVILHLPLAGYGWYHFMRKIAVRPHFAYVTSVSAVCGGFITAISTVWIFMLPMFAWLPWVFSGLTGLLDRGSRRRDLLLFVLGLTAIAYVGISQILVYVWLCVGFFAIAYALLVRREGRPLLRMLPALAAAALLTAPAILPAFDYVQHTDRAGGVDLATFLSRSVSIEALAGVLLPSYDLPDGFLDAPATVMFYQGGWIFPAILSAALALLSGRAGSAAKDNAAGEQSAREGLFLSRIFLASGLVALLFILFALGENGPIYRMTYGIPLWSSFRWPFKFLMIANPLVALTAGCGLEVWARSRAAGLKYSIPLGVSISVSLAATFLLVRHPSSTLATPAGMTSIIAGFVAMNLVCHAERRVWKVIFVAAVFVGAVGLTALCHDLQFKTYSEPYGKFNAATLGVDPNYRIMPMTVPELRNEFPRVQEYGLLLAPTANRYYSLTGCMYGMTPSWVTQIIPSNIFGTLPNELSAQLLGSNLLRSFNMRYVVVGKNDLLSRELLKRFPDYRVIKELENVAVYDNRNALPRVYFASNVFPYAGEGLWRGMVGNAAPVKSAFVEQWEKGAQIGGAPDAEVKSEKWDPNKLTVLVDAAKGGFLVVSQTWYPDWKAWVDGKPVPVFRVNGAIQGVQLPPGAREIVLRFVSNSLYVGIMLACAGLLMLVTNCCFIRKLWRRENI